MKSIMTYRMTHIVALLLACTAGAAAAQTLSITPRPGLWKSEGKILVNGQDIMATMRQAQAEMLKSVPPAQRAQVEAMMKAQQGSGQTECLTAAESAELKDPQAMLARMHKETPQCRYQITKISGNTVSMKGRCEDPDGYTGDIEGSYTALSETSARSSFSGTGNYPKAAEIPGVKPTAKGQYTMSMEGTQTWVGANCPKKP